MALTTRVGSALGDKLYDLVPSYNSVMIYYNVLSLSENELREQVRDLIDELAARR